MSNGEKKTESTSGYSDEKAFLLSDDLMFRVQLGQEKYLHRTANLVYSVTGLQGKFTLTDPITVGELLDGKLEETDSPDEAAAPAEKEMDHPDATAGVKVRKGKVLIPDIKLLLETDDHQKRRLALISIDMQNKRRTNFFKRFFTTLARLFANQLPRGGEYDSVLPTIVIGFVHFMERGSDKYVHRWCLREDGEAALPTDDALDLESPSSLMRNSIEAVSD